MLDVHARALIKELLETIGQAGKVPIVVYGFDEQWKPLMVGMANDAHLPGLCRQIWEQPEGMTLCQLDMARRAGEELEAKSPRSCRCHAGLRTESIPIIVDEEMVGVLHFGGFAESDIRVEDPELEWLKKFLPAFISRLVDRQAIASNQERHVRKYEEAARKLAYHDVQLRLQSALAQAENHVEEVRSQDARSWEITESAVNLLKTIELAGTVLQNLMQGEYLPDEYEFRQINLREIITSAIALANPMASQRHIVIRTTIHPDRLPIVLQGSVIHLQQAFNNLIHNAVKYSHRGSELKTVEVSVRGSFANHGYQLFIENYGIGILPEEYDRIFEPGYKGILRQRERQTGSGLGLPLTKEIIEKHLGKISVRSEPDRFATEQGDTPYLTTFSVWLPLTQPGGIEPMLRLVKGERHG